MDFEQKFLEELEKYKRKRSLSALADKAGDGINNACRCSAGQTIRNRSPGTKRCPMGCGTHKAYLICTWQYFFSKINAHAQIYLLT